MPTFRFAFAGFEVIQIIPAVVPKRIDQQGGAQQLLNLSACHADFQLIAQSLCDDIALLNIDFVGGAGGQRNPEAEYGHHEFGHHFHRDSILPGSDYLPSVIVFEAKPSNFVHWTAERVNGVKPLENSDLKKAGLKATGPRLKILEILESGGARHMSAEDVYRSLIEQGEEVGLATVYRVLTQFETAGLVRRHHFEGGNSVFELDQGEHHDHLLCVKCGRVDEFVDAVIEKRQQAVAANLGYEMTDHTLTIYGVCKECQRRSS